MTIGKKYRLRPFIGSKGLKMGACRARVFSIHPNKNHIHLSQSLPAGIVS